MKKNRILVIEDEPALTEMLKVRLAAHHYEVSAAYDGLQGLEAVSRNCPDLIILDLLMPELDGFEVCKKLKSDERYKKIPIIVLTASVNEPAKHMTQQLGAEEYLTKPFEAQELLDAVSKYLPLPA